VFDPHDVVFAWAIGKALVILFVSLSTLVFLAWAVTRRGEVAAHVERPRHIALKYRSSVKMDTRHLSPDKTAGETEAPHVSWVGTSADKVIVQEPEQPIRRGSIVGINLNAGGPGSIFHDCMPDTHNTHQPGILN